MTPAGGGEPSSNHQRTGDASPTRRLARDLAAHHAPPPDVTPWGLVYDHAVMATAVPPPAVARTWAAHEVVAATGALRAELAVAGIAASGHCRPPLVPRPHPTWPPGPATSGVVCWALGDDDDATPEDAGLSVGAFLLCWALEHPRARLLLPGPRSTAVAAALGYQAWREPVQVGRPAVVVCSGTQPYPPPLIIDALAAAIPVLGRRTAALVEVVGDAGLLVDPAGGPELLGEALAALLDDTALATHIGGRGPARVEQLAPDDTLRRVASFLRAGAPDRPEPE